MRTIAFILCISIYFIYLSVSTQSPPLVKSLSTAFSISVPSLKVYWCLLEQCVFEIQHPTLGYLKWSCFCCSVIQPLKSQWKNWMILVRDSCASKINIYQFVWKTSNHKFVQQGEFPGLKVIPWSLSIQYISLLSVICLQMQRGFTIKSRSVFLLFSRVFPSNYVRIHSI